MNITLGKPLAISEKGRRQNNEDYVYPLSELVNANQKLFIVCDGVGGAQKGEIASVLACESIRTFFSTFIEEDPSHTLINKAVQYTETRFDEYVAIHPEAHGMATTMTLLYIGESGVTVAHVGDSRIYQFRDGNLIFKTEDHSLVNEWVKQGMITSEEAFRHPRKNIITRAIHGTSQSFEADVIHLTDIQSGDYFFMCTDGVTDCIMDTALSQIFEESKTTDAIKNTIIEKCSSESRDNYSFYIIPIQNIQNSLNYRQFISSFFYIFT